MLSAEAVTHHIVEPPTKDTPQQANQVLPFSQLKRILRPDFNNPVQVRQMVDALVHVPDVSYTSEGLPPEVSLDKTRMQRAKDVEFFYHTVHMSGRDIRNFIRGRRIPG